MKIYILITSVLLSLTLASSACGGPSEAEQRYNEGVKLSQQWRLREAIEQYDVAIRLDSQHADAYAARGAAYYGLSQFDKAIKDLNVAIRLNRKYAEAYAVRGSAYAWLGNSKQAIADWGKAISLTDDKGMIAELEGYIEALEDNR